MPVQHRSHPDANVDGFVPPEQVDWHDVLAPQIDSAPSYEPDDGEKQEIGAIIHADDEDFEGAPPKSEFEYEDQPSPDPRFEYHGPLEKWPQLHDVYAAIDMSISTDEEEPIGETDKIALETLRQLPNTNRWFVDDVLQNHFLVQHDPSMNHPLSAKAAQGDLIVWVYERDKPESFPAEPAGLIYENHVFRRPKVWHKA